jgi:hypothetical protein
MTTTSGQPELLDLLAPTRPDWPARCAEREAAAWKALAALKPFDKITLQASAGHIHLIVVSVHAGSENPRDAHLICAERLTRATVTVVQPSIRGGDYWIIPGWAD